MATIKDLKTSISELSLEPAFTLILGIRQSRLTAKVNKFTIRAKKASTKAPKKKKDPFAGIDKAELIKLLKESLK